jgi:hypothetical protein
MSVQTIKSSLQTRVNTGVSNNMAVSRLNNQYTALCGASWPDLQNDIFGRNVGHLGVDMRGGGAECNDYMPPGQSLMNHITRENLERPYVQIAPEGARGVADLMGKGRELIPMDLYGTGERGNFVRYNGPGLTLPDRTQYDRPPPIQRVEQNTYFPSNLDFATNQYIR